MLFKKNIKLLTVLPVEFKGTRGESISTNKVVFMCENDVWEIYSNKKTVEKLPSNQEIDVYFELTMKNGRIKLNFVDEK